MRSLASRKQKLTLVGSFIIPCAFFSATIATVTMLTGCSTPHAIPSKYDVPAILDIGLPLAQRAVLEYADAHHGRLPETSPGEQIVVRSVTQRNRTIEEVDASGTPVSIVETIDSIAYVYRPARETFILAVGGHIVGTPVGGGDSINTWFAFHGRYDDQGHIIPDKTSYFENADLFIDAMRSTSNEGSWNSSAWAISTTYLAVLAVKGEATTDAIVDRFVKAAVATGLARVPSDMTPREAAFGGVKSNSMALPPAGR